MVQNENAFYGLEIPDTKKDRERLQTALKLAEKAHSGQTRRYSHEPFVWHPIRVMRSLSIVTSDVDVLCAALLHDVLEDSKKVSASEIKKRLGPRVLSIVQEVTNAGYGTLTRKEKVALFAKSFKRMSSEAQLIKIADWIDNCFEIHRFDERFFSIYFKEKKLLAPLVRRGSITNQMLSFWELFCTFYEEGLLDDRAYFFKENELFTVVKEFEVN